MSDEMKPCPNCECPYGYYMDENTYACPECQHEWDPNKVNTITAIDANGNELQTGDTVVVIKNLNVKGAQGPIKIGTKIKNIRIVEGDGFHNIDCKIDGFGAVSVTSQYVKKA